MKHALLLIAASVAVHAAEDSLRLVRSTDALTPAEEQARLHVPEGFTVQLFASEPMINKPINMAFDARGRLWVSSTVEYPYSADKSRWSDPQGTRVKDSRDAIKVLEDTDGDGKADKVTDFANGLNIPTGVLPWHKPEDKAGCIAWSIPNIWYLADTDGDGKCDKREVLFGPLGYEKDTHGMCSSFRLGLDGWVYATHGFNNTSHLKAKDGSTLDLHSGNVFRFRPDGSHVEIWSWGQVNPFGLCWDRYNNLYSADCHSNPITQLIRGAYYPSFGKPHDGLGYGPVMCEHSHGSTGLCGIIYIDGGVWEPEWDDHMLLGNCVTSKVNHDKITFTGSTPKANEQPDFLTSDDPWFRPVDLQLGPDNALYIADFYNKIIGHYEVPLDHPGRDKERGRIWRVVRSDEPSTLKSWNDKVNTTEGMKWALSSGNSTCRRLAAQFFDLSPQLLNLSAKSWCATGDPMAQAGAAEPYVWFAMRHGDPKKKQEMITTAVKFLSDQDQTWGRLSARLLMQIQPWDELVHGVMKKAVAQWPNGDLLGLRAIIDSISTHPDPRYLQPLLERLTNLPPDDVSLKHMTTMTIREQLKLPGAFALLSDADTVLIADIARTVPTPAAGSFLLDHWFRTGLNHPDSRDLAAAACHGDTATVERAIELGKSVFTRQTGAIDVLESIHNALLERGSPPPKSLLAWATELAESLLSQSTEADKSWTNVPTNNSESPWCLQERRCADGKMISVLSSLNQGLKGPEKLTGILRSRSFAAPDKLSFWLCGHQGFPTAEANKKNLVRLVDDQGAVLHEAYPPRHNDAQRIEWDLASIKGKQVRLEIVDGDNGTAYAWLGVGRFEQAVLSTDTFSSADSRQKQLKTLATILRTTAPVGLRDRLAAFLPQPASIAKAKPQPEIDALIKQRITAFAKAKPDTTKGEQLFTANCAVCHTISGKGGLIGPQLDGIGNRGAERLFEDILDPNRNVDAHFHLHQMKLRDGSVATGFVRGEVGQVTILVDAAGNEQRLSKGDITEDTDFPQSLMPPTFGQVIPPDAFNDLIGWLLKR